MKTDYSYLALVLLISFISCKKEDSIEDTTSGPNLNGLSVIYSSNQDGHNELSCVNDLGVQVLASSFLYDYWWAKVSPDQSKILYYRSPANPDYNHDAYDTADLMVADLNGNAQSVLIPHGAYGWNAQGVCRWHPSADKILMIAEVDLGSTFQWRLLTTETDGSSPEILSDWWIIDPNFSPDGSLITFMAFPDNVLSFDLTQLELHRADYDLLNDTIVNIERMTFNSTRDHDPSFSPDGTRIVFSAGNASYTNVDIKLFDLITNAEQPLVDDNAANGGSMCFSPDGNCVFFHSLDILAHPFQIKKVKISDGSMETILSDPNNNFGFYHPEVY